MNPIEIKRGDSFQNLSKYLLKGKSNVPSPEQTLSDISQQNSVFTRQDIARHLNKTIDDSTSMSHAIDKILASPDLVKMQSNNAADKTVYYSTWEMVSIEKNMMEAAERMAEDHSHRVNAHHIEKALGSANLVLQKEANADLSDEQTDAVRHVTGAQGISIVTGLAGAGKSTMLAAAREAWEAEGYNVVGGALAGKAAEGLQESSNIVSRTLASYEFGWKNGYGELTDNDVLVIDEAGMVGSRQLSRFVEAAEKSGAKLVLVGDSEQLQAIGAGAPFRQSVDVLGAAELENVLRQREEWQQQATKDFAQNRTTEALGAYQEHGYLGFHENVEETILSLADDYLADIEKNPNQSRLALTHRRVDVKAINELIRDTRLEKNQIDQGVEFKTANGKKDFSVGDRLIFLENNRDLNVKNGMLGTVVDINNGVLTTQIDGKEKRIVELSDKNYNAIDYGYASTIHKSQGMSVDRSFVMASYTMDRHLSYVAMSRHRESTKLYVSRDQFNSIEALATRLGREGLKRTTLDFDIDMTRSMRPGIQTEEEDKTVGWTQTYNLENVSDVNAWKVMKATADSAADIKKAVAEANGEKFKNSKKCTKPVYHFSITWPEIDNPSEKLQRLAVGEVIKELGMENYQAMAVQHLDGKPHVHVMLNLIDPDTGMSASTSILQANGKKASKLTNSRRKLRSWANRFEKKHGLQITEGSHENIKRREAGEKVHAHRKSRITYEREKREGQSVDLHDFAYQEPVIVDGKEVYNIPHTASKIGLQGKDLEQKHHSVFVELNAAFKTQMQQLYEKREAATRKHEKRFSADFKSKKTALARSHYDRMRQFDRAERSSFDSMINAVSTFFIVKKERESVLKGLYAATSSKERRDLVQRFNKAEFAQLYSQERTQCAAYIDTHVTKVFDEKIDNAQKDYLKSDQRLRNAHSKELRELRKKWREYSIARAAENRQSKEKYSEITMEQSVEQGMNQSLGLHLSPD